MLSALLSGCVLYKGKPNQALGISSLGVLNATYVDQGTFGYRLSELLIPKDEKINFWPERVKLKVVGKKSIEVTVYSKGDEEYTTVICEGKDFQIEDDMLLVGFYNTTNTYKGGAGAGVLPLPPMASTATVKKYITLSYDTRV